MSLQITYSELRREVGRFLGYDRTPSNWETNQTTDVADVLRAGQRLFYWPAVGDQRYTWSFMRKRDTIVTADGTSAYRLAPDFSCLLEGFSYNTGTGKLRIARASEEELSALLGKEDKHGTPEYCALRPVQPSDGSTTRWEVVLYPTPDAVYTLAYRYVLEPTELDDVNVYHLGGAAHSECFLEACLSAAEKTLLPEHGNGVHTERFGQLLAASIKIDSEMQ